MSLGSLPAFGRRNAALQVQTVLYNTGIADLLRAVHALARAVEIAVSSGALSKVVLRLGDSSTIPALDEASLRRLREATRETMTIDYDYFAGNLGSAAGHNRLAAGCPDGADFLWMQNPDVVVSPRLFETVLEPFSRSGVGQVEAKQLPVEHPKDYDPVTGETEWTTTACVMTPLALFREVGGFDADTFFMYCDDVDLSFRIRELGYRTLFQPAAVCFHDKRLTPDGAWQPSGAEQYYSAEAGLMMAHKWSYPAILDQTLKWFDGSGDANLLRAAESFRTRRDTGSLPAQRDHAHAVTRFMSNLYTRHRFAL